ncbi:MAG: endonuclease/exonuclease/phosphatase family protein [Phycisphaeraceae bacterium]|nr:endonuclease/exonuclease/phosphatase family protein [Phycisphaeraceae bacterium]
MSARPTARRWQIRFAWMVVFVAAGSLAFGWLWPDLGDDGRLIAPLNWLAFMLRTFTPHAAMFLALSALLASQRRLWRPAASMLTLAACCAAPIGLSFLPREGQRIADADAITIMSCNVMYGRANAAAMLAEIDAHGPDVLVIQEYTGAMHTRVGHELSARFPHSAVAQRDDAFGMAVYSRIEFSQAPVLYPALRGSVTGGAIGRDWTCAEPQIRVVIRRGEHEIVVQGVHTLPPIRPSYLREQRRLVRGFAAWAERERRPVILAGDLNHTSTAQSARWLARAGLTDTHAAAGNGRGLTWPDGAYGGLWRVLGFRLDHIFAGAGLACEWTKVGASIDGDHRPVIARIGTRGR